MSQRARCTLPALAVALGCVLLALPGNSGAQDAPIISRAPRPDAVLFIGNSFVYYNNSLHGHVRRLTHALEPKQQSRRRFKSLTISGARLEDHLLGARGMIQAFGPNEKKGAWDVVVLQGHSREAIEKDRVEAFESAARTLDEWIREIGARPVFFMTWAYADKPEMTSKLAAAYAKIANETVALVVPVGLAFERALAQQPDIVLHTEDKIHPSPLGTYLAANVFYAALYGRSPVGAKYDAGLDAQTATFAQRIAWQTVKDYYASRGR